MILPAKSIASLVLTDVKLTEANSTEALAIVISSGLVMHQNHD